MSINLNRISSLVQRALANMLIQYKDVNPLFVLATITYVDLSPNLANGKIFVTVLDESKQKEIIKALNDEAKFFRGKLARAVKLRATPKLKFVYDQSILRGQRISAMIDAADKSNKHNN